MHARQRSGSGSMPIDTLSCCLSYLLRRHDAAQAGSCRGVCTLPNPVAILERITGERKDGTSGRGGDRDPSDALLSAAPHRPHQHLREQSRPLDGFLPQRHRHRGGVAAREHLRRLREQWQHPPRCGHGRYRQSSVPRPRARLVPRRLRARDPGRFEEGLRPRRCRGSADPLHLRSRNLAVALHHRPRRHPGRDLRRHRMALVGGPLPQPGARPDAQQ